MLNFTVKSAERAHPAFWCFVCKPCLAADVTCVTERFALPVEIVYVAFM